MCVEHDQAALQVLSATLVPYGFAITNITNDEDALAHWVETVYLERR